MINIKKLLLLIALSTCLVSSVDNPQEFVQELVQQGNRFFELRSIETENNCVLRVSVQVEKENFIHFDFLVQNPNELNSNELEYSKFCDYLNQLRFDDYKAVLIQKPEYEKFIYVTIPYNSSDFRLFTGALNNLSFNIRGYTLLDVIQFILSNKLEVAGTISGYIPQSQNFQAGDDTDYKITTMNLATN